MKKKKVTVTLDWEQCEMIAAYYEFPSAIFFFTKSTMKEQLKGTSRLKNMQNLQNGRTFHILPNKAE